MAVPAGGSPALILPGDIAFLAGGLPITDLTGVFVKSVSATGLVTYQNAAGVEQTAQLSVGSGATITTSFVDPIDGSEGDLHFKVDALGMILSIWFRSNIQWAALGLPGQDGTVLNGNGAPAGNSGENGDTYRDDETGAWYKKASGAWSAALYTPAPSGHQCGADFPAAADADAGVLYGDGSPTPESIGFLRSLGETHVAAFRTAHLGNGFFGFAAVAGSAGPTFRKGGDVGPRPEGLLSLAFHVSSLTSNGLFVDVDTAAGLFMAELTSIEVSITREGMTAQTYLLTTVTEVETGIRRFQDHFTVPSGAKLYEAG